MKKYTFSAWGENTPKAYVSNGFIGFRYGKDPFCEVDGFLAGYNYTNAYGEVEAPASIPTPKLEFFYRNEQMKSETLSQTYDFSNGELTTHALITHWIKGKYHKIRLTYTVFSSRTSPTVLVSTLKAEGEMSEKLKVRVSYAPSSRWADSTPDIEFFPAEKGQDGKCLFHSSDGICTGGAAVKFFGDFSEKLVNETMSPCALLDVRQGQSLTFVTSYVPALMHVQPHNQAQRLVRICEWYGIQSLRENNRAAWAKLWESRITIDGADEKWQEAIDASFFYLMTSFSEFTPMSVSPFGLSYPELYYGHVFWDTESFMYITPLFMAPDIAKNMLDYRYKRLEAARNHAKLNGCVGVQFPWESGISGCEMICTRSVHAGEHHINLDVALAFDIYAKLHPDEYFLKEMAWPVIYGVCEWIQSRVVKTERGYELHHTTGIDEVESNVNNDAYTNKLVRKVLRIGVEYSKRLGYGNRENWSEIADLMFLPRFEDGVLMQHDSTARRTDHYPSVAMSYFPYACFEGDSPEEIKAEMNKNIEFYMNNGMEENCKGPMLSGFLGVFPAWLGDREKSLEFYETANLTFFTEPFHTCTEFSLSEDDRKDLGWDMPTNFITSRGSFLSGLIMGLTKFLPWSAGLDSGPEDWLGEDIVLPKGWNKITVGKIYVQGKAYRLEAENGAKKARLIEL